MRTQAFPRLGRIVRARVSSRPSAAAHAFPPSILASRSLLLTRNGKFEGDNGMLKICDFGTSALCEGDNGAQKTAGTPPFFSPELCSKETVGTYDNRVVDLWAVGVTVYLWVCGRLPFMAPTVMLLMEAIKGAEGVTRAPKEASAGLASVIEGLLTRDTETRLTLMALREHPWLTDNGKMVMPPQPVMHVEVSAEEIEQAFSNRAAMMAQSAAGPSHLGLATGYKADWKREGLSTIRKKCTKEEAEFYRSIAACGHLSNHIPVIYSVKSASEVEAAAREGSNAPQPSFRREKTRFFGIGTALGQAANSFTAIEAGAPAAAPAAAPAPEAETVAVVEEARESTLEEDFEIRMQDLAAGMTWPCAMAVAMGTRTALAHDFSPEHLEDLKPNLLDKMNEYDPSAATEAEKAAGGVNLLRYLSFLDDHSSTKQHGFRIDAARTIVEGEIDDLPLPSGLALETLKEETMVCKALATFLQNDAEVRHPAEQPATKQPAALHSALPAAFALRPARRPTSALGLPLTSSAPLPAPQVAKGFVVKLETLITALSRSAFFKTHALVRSSLLLFYDDVARLEKLELKMINFGFSYALPEGQSTDHLQPWDGTAENHEDGYLTGVKSLLSVMKKTCELIEAAPKTYSI